MQLTYTQALLSNMLTQSTDPTVILAGKLAAAKLALFSNVVTPAPQRLFGDLTECIYSGYAESATVVWALPINETDGTLTQQSPSHLFRMSGGSVGDQAAGIAVTDGVASPSQGLLALGLFDVPFVFTNIGDGFSVIVAINVPATSANAEIALAF